MRYAIHIIMIIGVVGYKGSGKDTLADYLVSHYGYTKESFAYPVKEICRICFSLTDQELYGSHKEQINIRWQATPRYLMQIIGTELFRQHLPQYIPSIDQDIWIRHMAYRMQSGQNTVIPDTRFSNEVDFIRSKPHSYIILIERPGQTSSDHASEQIQYINPDHILLNDGSLQDLYHKIDELMNHI